MITPTLARNLSADDMHWLINRINQLDVQMLDCYKTLDEIKKAIDKITLCEKP